MRLFPEKADVLIVGAGPSGLMMAAQLLRNGIHPLILDSKTQSSQSSDLIAVQARSLEVLKQLDLDALAVNQGNKVKDLHLLKNSDEIFELDFDSLGMDETLFPFVLLLEQSKLERILSDYLTLNACPIYWNCAIKSLKQTDEIVDVVIEQEGKMQSITSKWLIGADGSFGKTKELLSIPYSKAIKQQFYAAVFNLPNESPNGIRLFFNDEGFAGLFPMKGRKLKIIGLLPKTLSQKEGVDFEDIKPYLTYTLNFPFSKQQCTSFSIKNFNPNSGDKYRIQRCFLIGDSAHSQSLLDKHATNSGFQDAFNLGWKLAGVIKGEYGIKLLETYENERRLIAKQSYKLSDIAFSIGTANRMLRSVRDWILPTLLAYLEKRKPKIFGIISQIGLSYRDSRLSIHHSQSKKIKAGDRLPYIKIYDEKLKVEADLHSWCSATGFTLLVLGNLNARDLFLLAKWIKQTYPFQLNFFYLPPSTRNQHVFDRFEMTDRQKKALIVRPDMHIGYMNDAVVIEMIDTYLKETIGWKT